MTQMSISVCRFESFVKLHVCLLGTACLTTALQTPLTTFMDHVPCWCILPHPPGEDLAPSSPFLRGRCGEWATLPALKPWSQTAAGHWGPDPQSVHRVSGAQAQPSVFLCWLLLRTELSRIHVAAEAVPAPRFVQSMVVDHDHPMDEKRWQLGGPRPRHQHLVPSPSVGAETWDTN